MHLKLWAVWRMRDARGMERGQLTRASGLETKLSRASLECPDKRLTYCLLSFRVAPQDSEQRMNYAVDPTEHKRVRFVMHAVAVETIWLYSSGPHVSKLCFYLDDHSPGVKGQQP